MKKKVVKIAGVSIGLLLALSACQEREGVDYLSAGHPADPNATIGKTARMSRTLISENINVRPELEMLGAVGTGAKPKTAPMDHSKMDHSKMNHGGQ